LKGVNDKMSRKLVKPIKEVIKKIAVLTGETTSWMGLYQPKKPKCITKVDKD